MRPNSSGTIQSRGNSFIVVVDLGVNAHILDPNKYMSALAALKVTTGAGVKSLSVTL